MAPADQPRSTTGPHIPGLEDFELIGWGGFGAVFRAHQPALGRQVAVKVLSTASLDEKVRRRFDREQQAMGSLSAHPAIVTLYSSGFTEEGLPYLVMELMEGGSLADRLKLLGPMDWRQAVDVMARIGDAVEEAHRAGVLHRDIKPENILMSRYGEPKLTDFGIAALMEGTATATTSVTATVEHASPEVLGGKPPRATADVYSLASTLFALLAGHSPFRRSPDESFLPILTRVATESIPDLGSRGIPVAVCAVVEAGLVKDPAERIGSAAEFARLLREAAAAASGATPPVVASPQAADQATAAVPLQGPIQQGAASLEATDLDAGATRLLPRHQPEPGPTTEPAAEDSRRPRPRRILIAAAVALLLGTGAGAFFILAGGSDQTTTTTQAALASTTEPVATTQAGTNTEATTTTAATTSVTAITTSSMTGNSTTTTRAATTSSSTSASTTSSTTSSTTTSSTTLPQDPVRVGVSPGSGSKGTTFAITATGLTAGGSAVFRVSYPSGAIALSTTKTADGSGIAATYVTVSDSDEAGRYTVRVTDSTSGHIGSAGFTVS